MTYSRQQLYAMGEPIGDSATRRECGRTLYGGGGSKSSSSSATTTTSTDKRIAVESGIGISSDSSTVNVQTLDGGIVHKALDTVKASDATAGEGFSQLLGLADKLFTGAEKVISSTQNASLKQLATTQDAGLRQMEILNTAANDKQGSIDQKTLIVLAVAGAAVLVLPKMAKGK